MNVYDLKSSPPQQHQSPTTFTVFSFTCVLIWRQIENAIKFNLMPTVENVCARLRHTLKVEIASQQNRQLILIIIIINAVNNKKTKLIKPHKIFHFSFARFRLQHHTCSRHSVRYNNSLPKVNDEINVQFKQNDHSNMCASHLFSGRVHINK